MAYDKRAGVFIRFVASILDFLVIVILILIVGLITTYPGMNFIDSWAFDLLYVVYLTLLPLVWGGYVIGKYICGIQVKREDGEPLTFSNMFVRQVLILHLLSYITFGIAYLVSAVMVLVRDDKRGLHDLIAGTCVERSDVRRVRSSNEYHYDDMTR